jgi:YgiT-type zinc finger domain-containing protein
MELDWGSCPCGGEYTQRLVEVRMTVEERPVVFENVPQGACPTCGSRVYKPAILSRLEAALANAPVVVPAAA